MGFWKVLGGIAVGVGTMVALPVLAPVGAITAAGAAIGAAAGAAAGAALSNGEDDEEREQERADERERERVVAAAKKAEQEACKRRERDAICDYANSEVKRITKSLKMQQSHSITPCFNFGEAKEIAFSGTSFSFFDRLDAALLDSPGVKDLINEIDLAESKLVDLRKIESQLKMLEQQYI